MEMIRLIGRNSRLSILQIELTRKKIEAAFPGIQVEVVARSSKGDDLQNIPLHTVEGSDFFTQDIFDALKDGVADIAVHSLKDMSSDHFFGENKFAVIDRNDTRDVAIFNNDVIEKIRQGKSVVIGTCSPRREEMATQFLKRALPQLHDTITIETKPIRGNVETRLRKLGSGEYDATILATAGLNRLLDSPQDAPLIKELLRDKRLMLLPLIECVPAPCQGAIVAEAHKDNAMAIKVLESINDKKHYADCVNEKKQAVGYGKGCLQKFGVTTVAYEDGSIMYAAGRDQHEKEFTDWGNIPRIETAEKNLFSSTDYMGGFFDYSYKTDDIRIETPVVYVSNYKAVQQPTIIEALQSKRVWASGTKTWYELASKGLWVEGCTDAFGLLFLEKVWAMPLINFRRENVSIITNEQGAINWREKGWQAVSTYTTVNQTKKVLAGQISEADIVFWTSFQQYEIYKDVLKDSVQHVCSSGETAALLRSAGLAPVVFPTIKAFQQWKKTSFPLRNAG